LNTLLKARSYFGCGRIYSHHGSHAYSKAFRLELSTAREWKKIISHFEKYPLQSKKQRDFLIWRDIAEIAFLSDWDVYRSDMVRLSNKLKRVKKFSPLLRSKGLANV
jgi:hypothetical protein